MLANDRDPKAQLLSLIAVTQGHHGKVAFEPNGTFIYTPRPHFTGTDTATYTVTNPQVKKRGQI